jgi:hypothetical protein
MASRVNKKRNILWRSSRVAVHRVIEGRMIRTREIERWSPER